MLREATLVGRDRELQRLRDAVASGAPMVLVVGEAGIGKSRLVEELVGQNGDLLALRGACLPLARKLPLLPLIDALDDAGPNAEVLRSAVASVPPGLASSLPTLMPRTLGHAPRPGDDRDQTRERLFLACHSLLSTLSATVGGPLLLLVEDVHWADLDTLDFLTYLASGQIAGLTCVVTCRDLEPDAESHVVSWLEHQRGGPAAVELVLGPLPRAAVESQVAELLAGHGDLVAADDVFALSEGNPFFTEQLVASRLEGERVPRRLAGFLGTRIRRASPAGQTIMTSLAVAARPLTSPQLVAVTGLAAATTDEAVQELIALALLMTEDSGAVRPRHALLREALLPQVTHARAASVHEAVGNLLERESDPGLSSEAAHHYRLAGLRDEELRTARRAAEHAHTLAAYADSARWWARVLELMNGPDRLETIDEDLAQTYRSTIRAWDLSGRPDEAVAMAERAYPVVSRMPVGLERLRLELEIALQTGIEDREVGRRRLDRVLEMCATLPPDPVHATALGRRGMWLVARGELVQGTAMTLSSLEVAEAAGAVREQAVAHRLLSTFARQAGDRAGCEDHLRRAYELAGELDDPLNLLGVQVTESDNLLDLGELERAGDVAERGLAAADAAGLGRSFSAHVLTSNGAEALLLLGRTRDAERLLESRARHARNDIDMVGDLAAVTSVLRGAVETGAARLAGTMGRYQSPEWIRIAAEYHVWAQLWLGRPDEAIDAALVVLELLLSELGTAERPRAGRLLSLAARAEADRASLARGGKQEAVPLSAAGAGLERLAASCPEAFLARATYPAAAGHGALWNAELARSRGANDPGLWLVSAEAWTALHMPLRSAYSWWRRAEALWETEGPREESRVALRTAYRLSAGHAPLRERIEVLARRAHVRVVAFVSTEHEVADETLHTGVRVALTGQETKVLRLVAAGLSNTEIGTELFISPKTVSVHVSNILRKLEVTNRVQAAAVAERAGLI